MKTPIALPLHPSINRCLGHGHKEREWCDRVNNCARNATIKHDATHIQACYRACSTDLMAAYMPLEGFEVEQ